MIQMPSRWLLTPSIRLAKAVAAEVAEQLQTLPKNNPRGISPAGERHFTCAFARHCNSVCQQSAPEHLSIPHAEDPSSKNCRKRAAFFWGRGARSRSVTTPAERIMFCRLRLGAGTRRIGALDFVKCSSTQEISRAGLKRLAPWFLPWPREGLEGARSRRRVRK